MRRNVRSKEQTSLDKLLDSLSLPGSCSWQTLETALAFLRPSDSEAVSLSNAAFKTKLASQGRTTMLAKSTSGTGTRHVSPCSSRDAQRIVKVTITTLKSISGTLNSGYANGSIGSGKVATASHVTVASSVVAVLADVCSAAIDVWSEHTKDNNEEKLSVARARYSLAARLLDLQDLSRTLSNLEALHKNISKAFDVANEIEDNSNSSPFRFLCIIPREELAQEEFFIMSVQLLTLKLVQALNSRIAEADLAYLCAVAKTNSNSRATDQNLSEYAEAIWRQLLRVASTSPRELQIRAHAIVVDSMLSSRKSDIQLILSCFCRSLDNPCTTSIFLVADTLAKKFVSSFEETRDQEQQRTILILSDRMTRQAQTLGMTEDASKWAQIGLRFAGSRSIRVVLIVDVCALALSKATSEKACTKSLLLLAADLRTAIASTSFSEQDLRSFIKSITLLRQHLLKCLKLYPSIAIPSRSVLTTLAEILAKLLDQHDVKTRALITSVTSATFQAWLAAAKSEVTLEVTAAYIAEATRLSSVLLAVKLQEETHALAVLLFNQAGRLYAAKSYDTTVELLELYFQWCPPTRASVKQLEYLWLAQLQCRKYKEASEWLRRAIMVESDVLTGYCIETIEATVEQYPYLFQLVSRFTKLMVDKSLPSPSLSSTKTVPLLLELQLYSVRAETTSTHWGSIFQELLQEALQIHKDADLAVDQIRLLGFAVSHYRRCNDLNNLRNILKGYQVSRDGDIKLPVQKRFTSTGLHQLRISLHTLLIDSDIVEKSQELSDELQLIASDNSFKVMPSTEALREQIFAEAADIFHTLRQPVQCLQTLQALLVMDKMYKQLSNMELCHAHSLAVEHFLSCGYDTHAASHLRSAEQIALTLETGSPQAFEILGQRVHYDLLLNEDTVVKSLGCLYSSLESLPRHRNLELQAKALLYTAKTADLQGNTDQAIYRATEGLKLIRHCLNRASNSEAESVDESLANEMDSLTMNSPTVSAYGFHKAGLILLETLSSLAYMYERAGMIRDALYYRNEALTAANGFGQTDLIYQAKINQRLLQQRAGKITGKQDQLSMLDTDNMYLNAKRCRNLAILHTQCSPTDSKAFFALSKQFLQSSRQAQGSFDPVHDRSSSTHRAKLPAKKTSTIKKQQATILLDQLERQISYDLIVLQKQLGCEDQTAEVRPELDSKHPGDFLACMTSATSKLQATEMMLATHPVYAALSESALSLPSTCNVHASPEALPSKRKNAIIKAGNNSGMSADMVEQNLNAAKTVLSLHFETWYRTHDSQAAYESSNLYNSIHIMHSSLLQKKQAIPSSLMSSNYFLEISRGIALDREMEKRDFELSTTPDLKWPAKISQLKQAIENDDRFTAASVFQAQYIDIIPKAWTVVSAGLSPSGKELILTRMQAERSPLILRLPVARHAARDADEQTFDYADAKAELHDIVAQSDASAQGARTIVDQKGKARWWALRQDLDTRMKTLLENIEHCWLGGFKGIFNSRRSDPHNLTQFRGAFARIIHKNVPLNKNRTFDIDSRVLDLFIDLGPIDADNSLELLEDLLYFILDIYQFHGESIAYDEIEIDQMVVDVQTALNKFHDSVNKGSDEEHTILMLDKDLHIFPWESLPCLRGKSVSRVPSIKVLKTLLNGRSNHDMTLPRSPGAFILNPSGDLKSTEKLFQPVFQNLPSWSGITSRIPEEPELIEYLESSSIFVYFGHGGGEQYIRASKLKKLKYCGAVILMGCSSGALIDQGIFDPWGNPYNYIVAGSPCVVANLWDVTDKDIDRFSLEMLKQWSLIDGPYEPVSICAAVALSRDECTLQYLNGAAPVVYGLPLHLA